MKRIAISCVALALAVVASPAGAFNTGDQGADTPPTVSYGPHSAVVHCNSAAIGSTGVIVSNPNGVHLNGCGF